MLAIYRDLLEIKLHYLEKIPSLFHLSFKQVEQSFQEGKFLLKSNYLTVDPELFREIWEAVIDAVIRRSKEEVSRQLLQKVKGKKFGAGELRKQIGKFYRNDQDDIQVSEIERGEIDEVQEAESLAFYTSLSPFFMRYAKEVREKIGFSIWQEGYCPVCGHTPFMAKLKEENGARLLECDLCFTQWIFPRLQCPFCKNDNQKTLRFFYIPVQDVYRVQVCEQCRSYLKTVNAQKLKREVFLGVENLVTLHLDMLAWQEGYKGGLFSSILSWYSNF